VNGAVRKWAEAAEAAPDRYSDAYVGACALCDFAKNPDGMPGACGACPVVTAFGPDLDGHYACHEFVDTDGTTTDALMSVLFLAAALGVEVTG
jgi:hypothetical protein